MLRKARWPIGIAAAAGAWYASDSLRHRREHGDPLGCGVRIFEYRPTMLHAKTLCVDGAWSSVGSVDFDNRSFQLHDEATLCVQSTALADRLGPSSSSATSSTAPRSSRAAGSARRRTARASGPCACCGASAR